jgi:hypothetical protein
MNPLLIIPALLLLSLLIFFIAQSGSSPSAPSNPTNVSPEASKNPGLFINFTNPDSYGDGSTTFNKFKFYLSPTKSQSDNKLQNSTIMVGSLPDGVTLSNGDLSLTDSAIKIKFDKTIVLPLEYDGEYWVGVQVFNDNDLASSIVWSDKSIKYDECKDDPEACWAGGASVSSGSFVYDEPGEQYTKKPSKRIPGAETGLIDITPKSRGPGEAWKPWWDSLSDEQQRDPEVMIAKCKDTCSSRPFNSRYPDDTCKGFNYNPTTNACAFKTTSSDDKLVTDNNVDFYTRNY